MELRTRISPERTLSPAPPFDQMSSRLAAKVQLTISHDAEAEPGAK